MSVFNTIAAESNFTKCKQFWESWVHNGLLKKFYPETHFFLKKPLWWNTTALKMANSRFFSSKSQIFRVNCTDLWGKVLPEEFESEG